MTGTYWCRLILKDLIHLDTFLSDICLPDIFLPDISLLEVRTSIVKFLHDFWVGFLHQPGGWSYVKLPGFTCLRFFSSGYTQNELHHLVFHLHHPVCVPCGVENSFWRVKYKWCTLVIVDGNHCSIIFCLILICFIRWPMSTNIFLSALKTFSNRGMLEIVKRH